MKVYICTNLPFDGYSYPFSVIVANDRVEAERHLEAEIARLDLDVSTTWQPHLLEIPQLPHATILYHEDN